MYASMERHARRELFLLISILSHTRKIIKKVDHSCASFNTHNSDA